MKRIVKLGLCGRWVVLGLVASLLAGCAASITSPDPSERVRALKNVRDSALLAKVVVEDTSWYVRKAAVKKLTDQVLLAKVATGDVDKHVREAAVEKLTDQALLMKLALEDKDWDVRVAAVATLTDQSRLATLTKHSSLARVLGFPTDRIAEIASICLFLRDPLVEGRLGKTKLNATREGTSQLYEPKRGMPVRRIMGGERITVTVSGGKLRRNVQAVWSSRFPSETSSESFSKRKPAYVNITDLVTELLSDFSQGELVKLIVEAKDFQVREAAVAKLTDQALLAKLAVEDKNSSVRKAAVENEKLMDQAVLAKVATGDVDKYVRQAAVEKLMDQTLLAKVAVEDKDWGVYHAALKKVTDQMLLAKVAMGDADVFVRQAAAKELTDQTLLAKVAVKDEHWGIVRQAAVERLTDQTLLATVEMEDEIPAVREAAAERLRTLRGR